MKQKRLELGTIKNPKDWVSQYFYQMAFYQIELRYHLEFICLKKSMFFISRCLPGWYPGAYQWYLSKITWCKHTGLELEDIDSNSSSDID